MFIKVYFNEILQTEFLSLLLNESLLTLTWSRPFIRNP